MTKQKADNLVILIAIGSHAPPLPAADAGFAPAGGLSILSYCCSMGWRF